MSFLWIFVAMRFVPLTFASDTYLSLAVCESDSSHNCQTVHALHGCISVPGGKGSHCRTVVWSQGISPAVRLSAERLPAITHDKHCSFRLKVTLLQLIIELVRQSGLLSHSIINYFIVFAWMSSEFLLVPFYIILFHLTHKSVLVLEAYWFRISYWYKWA